MNTKSILAGLALGLAAAGASATGLTCSGGATLGTLGPPGLETFGNSFSSSGTYTDCYTFSLNSSANSFGGTLEVDPLFNKLDIDVKSVSLYFGDTWLATDTSPLFFSFGGLVGGAYTLAIQSLVETDPGWRNKPVGYLGAIVTVAAPVPEPTTLALMLAGLMGVGLLVLRRRPS
jgi:hypothetical protein